MDALVLAVALDVKLRDRLTGPVVHLTALRGFHFNHFKSILTLLRSFWAMAFAFLVPKTP